MSFMSSFKGEIQLEAFLSLFLLEMLSAPCGGSGAPSWILKSKVQPRIGSPLPEFPLEEGFYSFCSEQGSVPAGESVTPEKGEKNEKPRGWESCKWNLCHPFSPLSIVWTLCLNIAFSTMFCKKKILISDKLGIGEVSFKVQYLLSNFYIAVYVYSVFLGHEASVILCQMKSRFTF